jgi:hypothetical protein
LGWFGGIDLRPESVLLFKVSGSISSGTNLKYRYKKKVCIKLRDTKRANMPKKEVDLESVAQ